MADRQIDCVVSLSAGLLLIATVGLAAGADVPAESSRFSGSLQKMRTLITLSDKLSTGEIADLLIEPARSGVTNGLEKYVFAVTLLNRREILQPPAEGNNGLPEKLTKVAALLSVDGDWRIRRLGAELSGRQLSAGITPAHRKLLEDSMEPVRHRAIEVLGMLPRGENVQVLENILVKHDETRVFDSVAAVRAMADLNYLRGLLEGLKDENIEIQLESIRGLARQSELSPEGEKALRARMKAASDERVRQRIMKLLEKKQ